jgi:ketosteroid isomerase-like protein
VTSTARVYRGHEQVRHYVEDNSFCQVWTVRDGRAVAMEEHATREQALAALDAG